MYLTRKIVGWICKICVKRIEKLKGKENIANMENIVKICKFMYIFVNSYPVFNFFFANVTFLVFR